MMQQTVSWALLGVFLIGATSSARQASAGVVPTQWIAKQYTELMGRSPTPSEWVEQTDYYAQANVRCNIASLAKLGKTLARSDEFRFRYPEPDWKAARVTALVRAVYSHDVNLNDWTEYYIPYANGTKTWDQVVDEIYGNGVFGFYLLARVCDPAKPDYGFGYQAPLDLLALMGAEPSRTQQALQAELDAAAPGAIVYLRPMEVVRIGGAENGNQGLRVPAGKTLATAGFPHATRYARQGRLVLQGAICDGSLCDRMGIVRLESGARLQNVWVDARGTHPSNFKLANIETAGSSASTPTEVRNCRVSEPGRDGTAIRARGFSVSGEACEDLKISGNLVTAYASQNTPNGLGQAQWADGISVFCEDTTVVANDLVDISDMGIVVYGAENRALGGAVQRSRVFWNTVLSAGNSAHAALAVDPVGECQSVREGPVVACLDRPAERSFEGTAISANAYWTGSRTHFDIGLMIGSRPWWGGHAAFGRGAKITWNQVFHATARVNMGISVLGMYDVELVGNSTHFALIDTRPDFTDLKCPVVSVGVGSDALASVREGSQSFVNHDSADGCLLPLPAPGGMEWITVGADGNSFVGATSGERFFPWGLHYEAGRPKGGAVTIDLANDLPRAVENLREIRRMGANLCRVLLQFVDYVDPPSAGYPNGTPNQSALDDLRKLVALAEQLGLYLDVTGLGIENPEDQQPWYDNRDEAGRWAAQKVFWKHVAGAVKHSPAVMFFDLMNEPIAVWYQWCNGQFGGRCFGQALTLQAQGRTHQQIMRSWLTEMLDAVRNGAGDANHLVSVGHLLPFLLTPTGVSDLIDFNTVHMYPQAGAEGVQHAIDFTRSCKVPGLPLLVEETYVLYAPGQDVEAFILGSRPEATGWMGFYSEFTPFEYALPGCQEPTGNPDFPCLDPLRLDFLTLFLRNMSFTNPAGAATMQP